MTPLGVEPNTFWLSRLLPNHCTSIHIIKLSFRSYSTMQPTNYQPNWPIRRAISVYGAVFNYRMLIWARESFMMQTEMGREQEARRSYKRCSMATTCYNRAGSWSNQVCSRFQPASVKREAVHYGCTLRLRLHIAIFSASICGWFHRSSRSHRNKWCSAAIFSPHVFAWNGQLVHVKSLWRV